MPPLPKCLGWRSSGHQRATPLRQGHQLWPHLRHEQLWPGQNLGIETKAAAAYIDKYFQRYPGVKQYMDDTKAAAKSMGYVETVFGRRLYLPKSTPQRPRRAGAERATINAPMQGTAADLIKMAMVAMQRAGRPQAGHPNDHPGARRTGVRTARGLEGWTGS